jgi:hypothetical protein
MRAGGAQRIVLFNCSLKSIELSHLRGPHHGGWNEETGCNSCSGTNGITLPYLQVRMKTLDETLLKHYDIETLIPA